MLFWSKRVNHFVQFMTRLVVKTFVLLNFLNHETRHKAFSIEHHLFDLWTWQNERSWDRKFAFWNNAQKCTCSTTKYLYNLGIKRQRTIFADQKWRLIESEVKTFTYNQEIMNYQMVLFLIGINISCMKLEALKWSSGERNIQWYIFFWRDKRVL